ncbi:ECF RNA polymerase sigma factor SigE [Aquisphaera giovannonii]|uniref:ECF RNA polymerase sigma factor SigE n=1 Tax=Aquisphaera giovannonii TaxID=406548 RepID=A0A5B9WB44_9BACT|nr:sigma-70 family RNA polymerase sigma factor [Aquisphaera giovannonii]QEH37707.1 ECF RNA polymerase sigma factor SigE [Aquisphaera giovannonii]
MRTGSDGSLTDDLGMLFRQGIAPPRDGALLERFVAGADDSAFEAIVVRHGPMVLGVCRRILAGSHDAEDTFQATFLVLARKAARLRDPDRVGPWLYGVATRLARKARVRSARHRHGPLRDRPTPEAAATDWSDVRPVLDAELGRLPRPQRDVLVLCLLEGASADEAAARLGCPVGTVKSRLARGRQSLRDRLVGRGIAPAIAVAAASAREGHASALPPSLIRTTLGAVASSATATGASILTRGATWIMSSRSTAAFALLTGGLAAVGIAAASWMSPSHAQPPGDEARPTRPVARGAAETQMNNLKQIGLALHNYRDMNDCFPPSSTYGPDGSPTLSWRVALLPFLNEEELYREFHQDEPWDSPHNKALAARMPAIFQTPAAPAGAGETRIRGYAGRTAFFEGTRGTQVPDITDGTSNTIMATVAAEPVPWTKPGDLPFVGGRPLPLPADQDAKGYQILLADGSVRSIPASSARFLPYLITRSGGEVIDWSVVAPTPAAPAAGANATPVIVPPLPTADQPPAAGAMGSMMRAMMAGGGVPAAGAGPGPVRGGEMTGAGQGMMRGYYGMTAQTRGQAGSPTPAMGPLDSRQGMMAGMLPGAGPDRMQALEQRIQRIETRLDQLIETLDRKRP